MSKYLHFMVLSSDWMSRSFADKEDKESEKWIWGNKRQQRAGTAYGTRPNQPYSRVCVCLDYGWRHTSCPRHLRITKSGQTVVINSPGGADSDRENTLLVSWRLTEGGHRLRHHPCRLPEGWTCSWQDANPDVRLATSPTSWTAYC